MAVLVAVPIELKMILDQIEGRLHASGYACVRVLFGAGQDVVKFVRHNPAEGAPESHLAFGLAGALEQVRDAGGYLVALDVAVGGDESGSQLRRTQRHLHSARGGEESPRRHMAIAAKAQHRQIVEGL